MVGGQGVGEEDLPAGRAKHNVIQTPVIGGGGQKGRRMQRGVKACAADSGGEVERMTKQGEVDTLQIPKSRPRAQEVIHIAQRLPGPHVHTRRSPTLDNLIKDEQTGHKV